MSAIAGIIQLNGTPHEPSAAEKLRQALATRSPGGVYTHQQEYLLMAYGHLPIHSNSSNEHQPLRDADWIITANARLINRSKLITLLGFSEQQYARAPDSRLLLEAYKKWKKGCLNYLEGEFAFAIANLQTTEIFLATDHLGHRPVYYYHSAQQFIFCSDLKGIAAIKSGPRQFDEQSLLDYWLRRADPTRTYDQDISLLPGGTFLMLNAKGQLTTERYWQPQNSGKYRHLQAHEWPECLYELLYRAVINRLPANGQRAGLTLSGGLDSTALACLLAAVLKEKNQPLYTFSSVLPAKHVGIERDERKYIDLVNRYCGNLVQSYIEAPGINPFEHISQGLVSDETFPNVFYYIDSAILQAAQSNNIRALYSGYGGDFWASWEARSLVQHLVNKGHIRQAWQVLNGYRFTESQGWLGLIRKEYLSRTKLYKQLRSLIKLGEINWSRETFLRRDFLSANKLGAAFPFIDNTAWMQHYITSGRMSKTLATLANRNESCGMSSALPMFDKDVIDFLIEVPLNAFVRGGQRRGLFKAAMQGKIPDEILHRKDKLPYAPGYHRRLIDSQSWLNQLIHHPDYDFVFDRYLDRKKIQKHLADVKPQAGFTPARDIVGIKLMQAGITALTLLELKKSGYIFR